MTYGDKINMMLAELAFGSAFQVLAQFGYLVAENKEDIQNNTKIILTSLQEIALRQLGLPPENIRLLVDSSEKTMEKSVHPRMHIEIDLGRKKLVMNVMNNKTGALSAAQLECMDAAAA